MKNNHSYIYYLEQMIVRVMKVWRYLRLILLKYVTLFFVIYISIDLSIFFLTDEIVPIHMKYGIDLELIKMPYSEDPLKLVLPFSIFAMVMSLWSVVWRVLDKKIEFKNAEFAQNELRFSNAVNLLSKTEDPIFPSEGIRELARLKRENKIDPKRIDQLTTSGITINKGSFSNADLRGINLGYANLNLVNLEDANLENATLETADLANANLINANLKFANLKIVNFLDAELNNANLKFANLYHTNLKKAHLTGANLENANLKYTRLIAANLENANLRNANLEKADFTGANLENAKLENTNHEKADFTDANITGTILEKKQP